MFEDVEYRQDVIKQYRELEEDVFDIESGRIPIPGYLTSSFTFEMVDNHDFEPYRKRSNGAKGPDHERKKGVPWTEEEHRNLVVSKTPTQVASHAQKYFQRQLSGGKDKKRPSIHDITTLSITTPNTGFSDNQSDHVLALHQKLSSTLQKADHNNDASAMALNSSQEGWFTSSQQYLTASNGLRFEGQNLYGNGFHGAQPPQSSNMGAMSEGDVAKLGDSIGTVPWENPQNLIAQFVFRGSIAAIVSA
ncbi:hypothetical protein GOBAR_AA39650 [Gossypium barbadense]|uniref:HTH myb-type domain-containing protein n=1 Tax=Gossypium barbadense TaxID=3634 RepID=A0A2P5VQF2_GOSBA|nr:hypothetical protein GOBAR_AA39650 [Gossypium barbadense]